MIEALWRRLRWWLAGLVALAVLAWGAAYWYTDWLWFRSLGFQSVLVKTWLCRLALFAVGTLVAWLVLGLNLAHSRRIDERPGWADEEEVTGGTVLWAALPALAAFLAMTFGLRWAMLWSSFLAAAYAQPAGTVDPAFGRDAAFYMLQLPFWSAVQRSLFGLLLLTWVGLYLRYVDLPRTGEVQSLSDLRPIVPAARRHLSLVGALVFVVWAWGFYLARFLLVTSSRSPVVFGISYADAHARLPLLALMCGVALVCAVALAVNVRRNSLRLVGAVVIGFAVLLAVSVLAPAAYQRLFVTPNETDRERAYITRCIAATRQALGLAGVEVQTQYQVVPSVPPAELESYRDTLATVPLWSTDEMSEQLIGTESLRTYYQFGRVDYDRYTTAGQRRQMTVVGREMQVDQLDAAARTWVNRHLVYTHGYGLVMASASDIAQAGRPLKLIGDVPPYAPPDLPLTRPEIYYGEAPSQYIITGLQAKATTKELNYPGKGDTNVMATYQGKGGVRLGGFFRRLLWAWRFKSLNILVSDLPARDSKIQFRRSLAERLGTVAPFLDYDSDPYPVLADGKIYWMADAHTYSERYPYGWPYALYAAGAVGVEQPEHYTRHGVAYIRNSVKAVVDAYDGSVTFYVFDPDCPILRTWQRAFPHLFQPASAMPAALREHIRYPLDLFTLQARAYARFHMTEPDVFYNTEDLWDLAREEMVSRQAAQGGMFVFSSTRGRMLPYYLLLRLHGDSAPRFRLVLPFTPAGAPDSESSRDNLTGWLAADCDPDGYGRLKVIQFPKDRLVYGPLQVEALIDQDPDISQQKTLWNAEGSRVMRGRLLVIPLGDSLLYVEPWFIAAERRGALPELRRVVVFYHGNVTMAETLSDALLAAMTGRSPTSGNVSVLTLQQQAREAADAYAQAEAARRRGDLRAYGQALDRLHQVITKMRGTGGDSGEAKPDGG